jgi:S1-C subfamily serine protease
MLALAVGACVHMPRLNPEYRLETDQERYAVVVESGCAEDAPIPNHLPIEWRPGRHGSGVLIDGRHVLTALHVVDCPILPAVTVYLEDGTPFFMNVVREDRDRDLALLEVASQGNISNRVAPPTLGLPEGRLCSQAAWPYRMSRCGEFDSPDGFWTASVRGNSGAGVYDEFGALVGIVTRSTEAETTFSRLDSDWVR